MAGNKQRWRQIACPTCHASAGSNCYQTVGSTFAHPERLRAAKTIALPEKLGRTNLPHDMMQKIAECSRACRRQRHNECSGKLSSNHGLKVTCKCNCHRRKQVTKDTLTRDSASVMIEKM